MFEPRLEETVLRTVLCSVAAGTGECYVPAAVSGRHIHLSKEELEKLFGPGHELTPMKGLSQPGQFACKETLTVKGAKGAIENVRVLGPLRERIQVELSMTDCFNIGIAPHIRQSGDISGTGGAELAGPRGRLLVEEGVIVAARHLHLSKAQAEVYGLSDGDVVRLEKKGERPTSFGGFAVRVADGYDMEAHIDIDEANAAAVRGGDLLRVYREDGR